jgi:hypothetical protein
MIQVEVEDGIFYHVSRNRIVNNVFKVTKEERNAN